MKLWYCLCLLFCVYYISILVDERIEVTYAVDNATNTQIDYLICMDLKAIFANQTVIQLSRLKNDLCDYFNGAFNQTHRNAGRFDRQYNYDLFNGQVLERIEARKYLLFNELFCLYLKEPGSFHFASGYFEEPTHFALDKDTLVFHLFEKGFNPRYQVEQLVVLNKPQPYSSCKRHYSRFRCLNDCYKDGARLSRYFYDGNETSGLVYLNRSEEDVVEYEKACSRRCKPTDCKLLHFVPQKYTPVTLATAFKAYPMMSQFNFLLQLASLVCLIFGLCFNQLASDLIESVILNFTKDNYFKRHLFLLKMIVLLVVLAYCTYLYVMMIADYQYRGRNPLKRESITSLLSPETVNLVICVRVESETSKDRPKHRTSRYRPPDTEYLMSKTLRELENETNAALNNSLDAIFLELQSKRIQVDWSLQSRVFFSAIDYSRCFQIKIIPKEVKYQRLLSITKLVVKFKQKWCCSLFLLADHENFNSRSFYVFRYDNFVKKVVKRSRYRREDGREHCVEYARTNSNCTSRYDCFDRCLIRRYLDAYSDRIPMYGRSIIDKRHFTKKEWNSTYLNERIENNSVKKQCEKEFELDDCNAVVYENHYEINPPSGFDTFSMELYYDVVKSIEEEASLYKLALDIANVQSVFFGLTVLSSLKMIYSFVRTRLKVRENKIVPFLICLLCSFGFIWHTSHIFAVIVHGELTESQHFKLVECLEMPVIALCFAYNRSEIDENHKLTGSYLEQLTEQYGAKQLFRRIGYLDSSRRWIELDGRSNFKSEDFRIETFFLLKNKCLSLYLERTYCLSNSRLGRDSRLKVLQIQFNHSFFDQKDDQIYFMTRKRQSMQFSKVNNFIYYQQLLQETYSVRLNDRFRLLKSPLSLFHDQVDDDVYLTKLLATFNALAPAVLTLNMPVKEKLFDQEIRDELFEQFSSQQNQTDQNDDPSPNYQRLFAINRVDTVISLRDEYEFTFSLSFFRKCIVISNEDGCVKLLLNLLNVLSLYLDSNLLDFHLYLCKIRPLFISLFEMLISLKKILSSSL